MRRAAHFLLSSALACSPPNDAIVSALLGLGYEVDLYAPGGGFPVSRFGQRTRACAVEYGKRWILKNTMSPRWRQYSVFSGTTESPMSVAGALSFLHRRPCFTLADEIFSGSYSGDSPEYWKRLCRWGMRRSSFSIVNDAARIPLQREYAGLPANHPIVVYPGCFRNPPLPADRKALRQAWGIPPEALVVASSGWFASHTGAEWPIEALQAREDIYVVLQPVGIDPLARFLLSRCRGSERMYVENKRLDWQQSWSSVAAVDIGVVVYLHSGPQFQNMGISSNRLCMFLSMGVPVIASRQPSFGFLEEYDCGVLVESKQEFVDAIGFIQKRLPEMKANAVRCAKEYIDAPGKYKDLVSALQAIG